MTTLLRTHVAQPVLKDSVLVLLLAALLALDIWGKGFILIWGVVCPAPDDRVSILEDDAFKIQDPS